MGEEVEVSLMGEGVGNYTRKRKTMTSWLERESLYRERESVRRRKHPDPDM